MRTSTRSTRVTATTTETRGPGRSRRRRRHPAANARLAATGLATSTTLAIMGGIALAQGGAQATPEVAPERAALTAGPEISAGDRSPRVIVVRRIHVIPGERTGPATSRANHSPTQIQSTAAPARPPTPTRVVAPPARRAPSASHATSSGSPG